MNKYFEDKIIPYVGIESFKFGDKFRIISGNPRFFKCRDESVMCPFICENYIYIAGYGN